MSNRIFYAVIFAFLLSGCATILNKKTQKIKLFTFDPTATVYLNNTIVGTGEDCEIVVQRDKSAKQIKVESKVFDTKYHALIPEKKSRLYWVSCIPFGVLFFPPFLDDFPKAYNFAESTELYPGDSLFKKYEHAKYIIPGNVTYNIPPGSWLDESTGTTNTFNYSYQAEEYVKNRFDQYIVDFGFSDSTTTFFQENSTIFQLDAEIIQIETMRTLIRHNIYDYGYQTFYSKINWSIKDAFGQSILDTTLSVSSDQFALDYSSAPLTDGTVSMIHKSMKEFFMLPGIVSFLKEPSKADSTILENYVIVQHNVAKSLKDVTSASVTVKTGEGHGSGFFIGANGEIITNYHVVAGNEFVYVTTNDNKELAAKVIRYDKDRDLALLKVMIYTPEIVVGLSTMSTAELGTEVFCVGTPTSKELVKSISKGIISGNRTLQKSNFYEIDASVNGGNSGGAVVEENGKLVGVVVSKLIGQGIEGVAFVIPSKTIAHELNLTISQSK
ncbi:MAG TPA: serine protease [Fluviicola sp.]|nr:serine protease [Fluviicola sp.]